MSCNTEPHKALMHGAGECIQCGSCVEDCELLGVGGLSLGEIAKKLLAGDGSPAIRDFIQRCDLCGFCTRDCPSAIDSGSLIKAARNFLVNQDQLALEGFELMFVDRKWNAFSLYRDTYNVSYEDLMRPRYDTLFFPGCSLATYAPELTRAAYNWLQCRGAVLGFTAMCCGEPLGSLGLEERKSQLQHNLARQLQTAGASRVVTVCANCHQNLTKALNGIEVVSLYKLLRDEGLHVIASHEMSTYRDVCVSVFSSLPDRLDFRDDANSISRAGIGYESIVASTPQCDA